MRYIVLEMGSVPVQVLSRSLTLMEEELLVGPLGRRSEIRLLWVPYPLFSLFLLYLLRRPV